MSRIRKSCGSEEDFDRRRLELSISSAGAPPETAKRIAEGFQASGVISSDMLRNVVAQELMKENPTLSRTYMATENLVTKIVPTIPEGRAHVSEDVLRYLRATSGQSAVLSRGGKATDVRIEAAKTVHPKEIALSYADSRKLEAQEGQRVSVLFPH